MFTHFLRFSFVRSLVLVVDSAEVWDDDRNRKCNDEDPAEGTDSAHDFSDYRARHHVTITATSDACKWHRVINTCTKPAGRQYLHQASGSGRERDANLI